jgi:hypothetical protein
LRVQLFEHGQQAQKIRDRNGTLVLLVRERLDQAAYDPRHLPRIRRRFLFCHRFSQERPKKMAPGCPGAVRRIMNEQPLFLYPTSHYHGATSIYGPKIFKLLIQND